ncbi:MAG: hypothetical protein NVS3B26_22220 [Mycobacteriales bacterium]
MRTYRVWPSERVFVVWLTLTVHPRAVWESSVLRKLVPLLCSALLLVGSGVWAPGPAAAATTTVLNGTTPATTPFPDDRWTVPDSSQVSGRRIALPTTGCDAQGRSLCDDLTLINTLDGFDLQPRVTIPFSAPVDLLSITPTTVFLTDASGANRGGLTQLVFDPATNTVAGMTSALLSPDTTYTLIITNAVKAADGTTVDPCGNGCAFRSVPFTTMTSTAVLDAARKQLDAGTAYTDAGITDQTLAFNAVPGMTRSVFPNAMVTRIDRQDQVLSDPTAPSAFKSSQVIDTAQTASFVGFGSIKSPQYVDRQGVIATPPTTQAPHAVSAAQIGVTMMAGAPNPTGGCLKPVIFGPGFTRSKYDLFLSGDALPGRGTAVFATDPLGHAFGPQSTFTVTGPTGTVTKGSGFGRGHDLDGDGGIDSSEGVGPSYTVLKNADASVARDANGATIPDQPSPQALVGLRDGLIQTVIDNMALVRALEKGVDVDGDGKVDTCTGPNSVSYYGQSFGGIYGTMLLGTDPEVQVGVPNVPGGPIVDIARESGFRDNIARQMRANKPGLLNGGPGLNGFTEDLPLRLDPRVTNPRAGAVAIQEYFARGNWIERPGSPETYASRLAGTGMFATKKIIFQTAYTDGTVPNPTAGTLYRTLGDYSKVWIYRNDRTPTYASNPHGFLLDPTLAGRNQGQQQIGDFITSGGSTVTDPDGPGSVWEVATSSGTNYPMQLDCLHYADPQTGIGRTITGPSSGLADCPDRSSTVTAQVFPSPMPSASTSSPATPTATVSPTSAATASGSAPQSSSAPSRTALTLATSTPNIEPTQDGLLTATGQDGQSVELRCYSRPSATYFTARGPVALSGGLTDFTIHPGTNTRCYVRYTGDDTTASPSVVINVHTTLSLSAVRTAVQTYTFQGRNLPRRSGQLITLYRLDSNGTEIRTTNLTTDSSGIYRVSRRFTGSGTFRFVVRTSQTLTNANGASSRITVSVH